MVDDFVVQGAAAEGVRMADESSETRVGSAFVEESFEPAGGAAKIHVAERGGVGGCGRFRRNNCGLHSKVNFTRFCSCD